MADFDLIGRVRLQLENAELAKLDSKLSQLKLSPEVFTKSLDKGLNEAVNNVRRKLKTIENDMARVARSANKSLTSSFDERNKRGNRSQDLKSDIIRRSKERTREDARELADSEKSFQKREKLARSAVESRVRQDAAEIRASQDAHQKREQIARAEIKAKRDRERQLRLEAKRNDAIDAKEVADGQRAFQKRESAARSSVTANTSARAAEQKFKDDAEARFKGVRRIVQKISRSSLEGSTQRDLLDNFLPDLFGKGTDPSKIRDFNRGVEEFGNAVDKAQDAQKRAGRLSNARNKPPKPPKSTNPLEGDPAFEFGKQSALAARRFAAFSIAAGGLFAVVQAFREGITESVKFEQQLVKLAQVSNTSLAALGGFTAGVTDLSTRLGVSSADLIDSAVTIRQAGFDLKETNAALETLALTSLSPSFNDIKNTTEGLIALKSQFDTSADDFKREFGEINAVSKAFAVESEDIVTAIRKSGGAFKVAGGNVRELIALFTAVRSTTRESADTIATGFRTIFGRLQRPQVIEELRAFNIELAKEGKFVGPLNAIKEINKALGDVAPGDLQFARIAEQIGGIRQISKVIPLIQNFATAQRASNIALLGQNSLVEDSVIAQQSLANKLTKTKETFLAFAREITLGDQFKQLASGLLTAAEAFASFGRTIAPILPMIALGFGVGKIGAIGKFSLGFLNRLGGTHGSGSASAMDMSLLAGAGVGVRGRGSRFLRANGPGIAAGIGLAGIAAGTAIGNTDPLTNRNRFIGGRALAQGSSGAIGGAFAGGGIGTLLGGPGVGTAVGAALGFAAAALGGFTSAVQDAQDALEEQQFRPAIDTLTQSLSLVNAGKISPLGQKSNLLSGFDALKNRRLTATGAERDQLNGDIRQTVESLLQFIQVLSESSKTMTAFNEAGGEEAIKFISENSVLPLSLLKKQTEDTIEAFKKAENVTRNLVASQEKLNSQASLVAAFGGALADATSKANDMSQRFDFVANNLLGAGAVGVQFRGVAGFQDAFSRPGQNSNLNMLAGASNQAAGFLGPQFSGLGQQTVVISEILNQLPSILSDFAIKRPSGDIAESLDIFVRDSLNNIANNIPGGSISLEPIIDSIASSITSEISQQGKGQADAIQKILDAPTSFVEGVISGSGFEQIFSLFNDAATRFTERFNVYSAQFAQLTTKEINTREQLVSAIDQRGSRFSDVARIRDPRNFPIGTLRNTRRQAQLALLGPGGDPNLVNNPNAIRGAIGNIRGQILDKEADLQKSTEVGETKKLIEAIISLQGEAGALGQAFNLAADKSDEIAFKFAQIEKIQLGRDQRKQGAEDFIFGDRSSRNQLNLVTAATQLAAINPDAFFNPGIIADSLRPAIGEFLNKFSELDILPGLKGRDVRERLLERGAQRGVLNPQFLDDLKEGPNAAQEKLLKGIEKLALDEFILRQGMIQDERNNINILISGIDTSLDDFVRDLRKTLLEQLAQNKQNKLDSIAARLGAKGGPQDQLAKFGIVTGAGGDRNNVQNTKALELATTLRKLQGRSTAIFQTRSTVNSLENLDGDPLIAKIKQNGGPLGGSSNLLNLLADPFNLKDRGAGGEPMKRLISLATAEMQLLESLPSAFSDLGLSKGAKIDFTKQISDRLSDASDGRGNVAVVDVKDVVISLLRDASDAAFKESGRVRANAIGEFQGLSEPMQKFVDALINMPHEKFDAVAKAINELGDAKLDKVTEEFNNLNREAGVLTTTLQGLTGQIRALNPKQGVIAPGTTIPSRKPLFDALEAARTTNLQDLDGGRNNPQRGTTAKPGQPLFDAIEATRQMLQNITNGTLVINPNPQRSTAVSPGNTSSPGQPLFDALEATRQMMQNITNGMKEALNGKNGIGQILQGIPKSIELAATHKIEVTFNGAQVLAQLQPGLEQLVITETEKAINKFAANNLPGLGSFS